jgi:hypothetical protein
VQLSQRVQSPLQLSLVSRLVSNRYRDFQISSLDLEWNHMETTRTRMVAIKCVLAIGYTSFLVGYGL